MIDDVTDGCWTNVGLVESKLRLLLEQNDIQIIPDNSYSLMTSPTVRFVAYGHKVGGICIAHMSLEVSGMTFTKTPETAYGENWTFWTKAPLYFSEQISNNGRGNLNDQAADFAEETGSEFVAGVLAGRRDPNVEKFFETFPNAGEPPAILDDDMN